MLDLLDYRHLSLWCIKAKSSYQEAAYTNNRFLYLRLVHTSYLQIHKAYIPQKRPPPIMLPNKVGIIPFQMYNSTVICGAPSQIANGMNVILATTWSNPSETNANVGPHIPTTLDAKSWPWKPKKQAKHTNQLQPIPRKNIVWKCGTICFLVAKEITADLKGSAEKTSPSVSVILVKWWMNFVLETYNQI